MNSRTIFGLCLSIALIGGLVGISNAGHSGNFFRVDNSKSQFRVYVYKRGLASGFAHNHIMGVDTFRGSVVYKKDKVTDSSVMMIIDAKSLQVLDKKLSDDDKKTVKKNMDTDVLEVKTHKKIIFKSTKTELVKRIPATKDKPETLKLKVTGNLKLHGKERPITLPVDFQIANGKVTATGSTELKQSLWGIKPYSAFLGTVGVKDVVKIEFTIISKQTQ